MFRDAVLAGLVSVWFSVAAMAQTAPKAPTTPAPTGVPSSSVPVPGTTPGVQPSIEQMQQQLLSRFDVDRNGVLSAQEQLMAQEAMRREGINLGIPPGGFPGADQFAKQFDRDGDGKLNPQEAFAAQAAYQRMMGGGTGGGMRGGLRGGGGGGGGSAIPPQPLLAPPNGAGNKTAKSGNPLVQRFDKNGDGKLNAEEKAAAQAELKKEKGKGKDAKAKDDDGKKG
ncbi:MAG TPA: hypothetical protein VGI40_14445 [Pirellulaceae bacterium]